MDAVRELLNPKTNAIGFVRLALASCVLFAHGVELAGYGIDSTRWGTLAVLGFFSLSGLLVAQSFEHCQGPLDFIWRRTLRVYPGYWANLVMTAFVVIPITWYLSKGDLNDYWSGDNSPIHYVLGSVKLVTGFVGDIRHVFDANPVPKIVNGSLWTLPIEFICYIGLMALGWMGALKTKYVAPLLAVCFLILWITRPDFHLPKSVAKIADPMVIELYLAFTLGVCAYIYRDFIQILSWLGWLCALFSALVLWNGLGFLGEWLRPFTTAYLVLWLSVAIPIKHFERHGDISYGVYIYAFPITQALVLLNVHRMPLFYFTLITVMTMVLATASWLTVESPALKLKRLLAKPKPNPPPGLQNLR
jgi:peptidoglycan/LPS O-acetylase OafA/YrhL